MTEPSAAAPPQEAPRKASRTRTILTMVIGGPFLAVGGCALFLGGLNFNSGSTGALGVLGAVGFVAGVLSFIGGILWALARLIDRRFDKASKAT
jgi:ammonia channel protein AmtB